MSITASEVSLRNSKRQALYRVIVLLSVLPLAGCIASAPGHGGGQKPLTVTVSPSQTPPVSLPVSTAQASTQQFTAAVAGTSNQNVTWSLALSPNSAAPGSGSQLGTIDQSGLYTAPTMIQPCTAGIQQCSLQVAVVATSVDNSSFAGQAPVNVHVVVNLTPKNITSIGQGGNLQFGATVTGADANNQTVNWSVACTGCAANQGGGAFDPNNYGLYISSALEQGAPSPQNALITATSTFDTTQFDTFTIGQVTNDPMNVITSSAANATITCPAFSDGLSSGTMTCYKLDTSCPGVADYDAYLKVNAPASPIGTVIFATGAGDTSLYDNSPDFFYTDSGGSMVNGGLTVVQGVFNAGYTTAQVSFGSPFDSTSGVVNGWLQGPGGVRRLACRFAEVAQWVDTNIHNSGTPYCATGNSGGSGAIGYALSEYGLNTIFSMAEPTSGPVMTRLDLGCSTHGSRSYNGKTACTNPLNLDMSYSTVPNGGTAGIIDTAYQDVGVTTPTPCADGVNGLSNGNFLRFESDSIDFSPSKSPALPIANPPTNINVLFGGQDASNAIGEGEWWWNSVGPQPTQACIQNAPHPIPADPTGQGAAQIVTDIKTLCVVH